MKLTASILLSTYNAEKFIRPTIESVINQDFDKESYEIVVVDDGSKDKTVEILNEYKDKFNNLKVIPQENRGPAGARTRLIQEAQGEFLFMLSHDCIAEAYWIKTVLREFERNPKIAIVQGKLLPTKPINLPTFHCNNFTTFRVTFDTAEVAYRASAVDEIGRYFRDDFSAYGDDADFAWRLLERGYKFAWVNKVLMYHDVLPRKFWADIKNVHLMQFFPKLLKLHPRMRNYLKFGMVWASLYKYSFPLGLVLAILAGLFFSWQAAALVFVAAVVFNAFRVLRYTRNYNLSLDKKLFIVLPHRIIFETLLGFYLIYGSIKYRSLVV